RYANGRQETVLCLNIKNNRAIQSWVRRFEDQAWRNVYVSCWFMGGLFLLICAFWIWRGRLRKAKEIISGATIVEPEALQKLLEKQKIASPFHIGGVSLRLNTEPQHLMVCG